MQRTLDLSIKKHEIGTLEGAYSVDGGKIYPYYIDNDSWEIFKADMENNHKSAFEEYEAGSGGEMKSKGSYPPKMACFGSSSRMIYNLSKDIPGIHFEYKFPTTVGGIANMDGYLEKADELVFIEAKCREPYGKKPRLIEKKYKELYNYINDDASNNLNITIEDENDKLNVVFSVDGIKISYFDIKQMICHLLAVATAILKEYTDKNISFLYLCYNPKSIEIIDDKKKINILEIYDKMCDECKAIDFKALFCTVLKYLNGNRTCVDTESVADRFCFTLCDQENYLSYLS